MIIITFISITFCSFCVSASDGSTELMNNYSVELLTKKDGFVSSEIYSIVQDEKV
jgi:hypothetical protein